MSHSFSAVLYKDMYVILYYSVCIFDNSIINIGLPPLRALGIEPAKFGASTLFMLE